MFEFLFTSKVIDWILRLLLAGVFIFAALPKLLAPGDFAVIIAGYGLTPPFLDPLLAVALPLAELVVAALLLFDRRGEIMGSILLLAGFTMVLAYGITIGLDVDCGCFGAGDPEAQAYHGLREALLRDLLLLGCCGWLALRRVILANRPGQVDDSNGLEQTF